MLLKGSCHCGAVTFTLTSPTPVPYMRCYCTVCRKTGGGGGYVINLGGDVESLTVEGRDQIGVYQAMLDGKQSPAERSFCCKCASALWVWDSRWPELIHPFASAIDTDLPTPPQTVHIMQASRPNWVEPDIADGDLVFEHYPEESIEGWHKRHGLLDPDNA